MGVVVGHTVSEPQKVASMDCQRKRSGLEQGATRVCCMEVAVSQESLVNGAVSGQHTSSEDVVSGSDVPF